jgi:epoxyqueuosine reductase
VTVLADTLSEQARRLGFDLVGFARADDSQFSDYWFRWLAERRHGEMAYLAERIDERLSPSRFLDGAQTAICLAINYFVPLEKPSAEIEVPSRIARYALGEDYHDWIKTRLYALADFTRDLVPGTRTVCGVDTAPIAERELAARAGIGWVGKNTCIIHPRLGSFLFLATILTTLRPDQLGLSPAEPEVAPPDPGHCGTCTRCLEACPTGALHPDRPYQLDASRCISYLTIEHAGPIPEPLRSGIGDWLYGCDICQDVCPFNSKAPTANLAASPKLTPRHVSATVDAKAILDWTDTEWHPFSRRSAIRRLSLPLLKRNAQIVVDNATRRPQATGGSSGPE